MHMTRAGHIIFIKRFIQQFALRFSYKIVAILFIICSALPIILRAATCRTKNNDAFRWNKPPTLSFLSLFLLREKARSRKILSVE